MAISIVRRLKHQRIQEEGLTLGPNEYLQLPASSYYPNISETNSNLSHSGD